MFGTTGDSFWMIFEGIKHIFEFNPRVTWSTIIQILGFIGAIWGVSYQLKKQREMQKAKFKIELQRESYEKFTRNFLESSPTGVAMTW